MKLSFRIVWVVLLTACGPQEAEVSLGSDEVEDASEAALSIAVEFTENQFGVTFTNADGAWVIYKGCYGPKKRGGQNLTVGPGYIARLTARKTGAVIVEDETPAFKDWLY